ncbi:MAG TPA: TlpA disulfide reductase family protein [Chryseolinea sp.]|nr:TlpA disulfide reductase family protein [Chryseolinea sp.]
MTRSIVNSGFLVRTCVIALGIFAAACLAKKEDSTTLKTGTWRGTLMLQEQELPFHLDVARNGSDGYIVYLRNAGEKILLDEIRVDGDSIDIALHVFDANIKARIEGDELHGLFIKNYEKDYKVPFHATYGDTYLFKKGNPGDSIPDFSGKYSVRFVHEQDTTPAIGVIEQLGDSVKATFLTPTGDYRYIGGTVTNGKLQMSTFDGNHSYIFYATKLADGRLSGEYYSGKTWKESWTAEKSEHPVMPDPEQVTYLKPGFERIEFTFPDVNGKKVSLSDERYKNQVVILQIFGTWCPNCMDETKFLGPWYEQNKDRGVKIIGLAYERKDDFAYASARVKKMISKYGVGYDFVIAGTNDKAKASETLPMLNKVFAFPTTIFIGRDGKVRKIYAGFNGPGTGKYFDEYVQHFNETMNDLLSEQATARVQ